MATTVYEREICPAFTGRVPRLPFQSGYGPETALQKSLFYNNDVTSKSAKNHGRSRPEDILRSENEILNWIKL
jgi:hypothetical protein